MTPSARTSKPAPQRRSEILDAAQRLFTTKGVGSTSVEDILREVGIAKGTLYYHFSSKEEILRALVLRTTEGIAQRARAVAAGPGSPVQRFLGVLAAARVERPDLDLAEQLHSDGNSEFHILSIVGTVRCLTPILTGIVAEGIAEGSFSADHPRECVEILLTSAGMLLDEGIFPGEADQIQRRTIGLIHAAEVLLGCEPGSFNPVLTGGGQEGC